MAPLQATPQVTGRIALVCTAVVALALAGCGGSEKAATTATTSSRRPPGDTPLPVRKPVTSTTYTLELSGTNGVSGEFPAPPGASNGSGLAVISINAPTSQLCWKFSQLRNVPAPTFASFYFRPGGEFSWSLGRALGRTYKSSGCVPREVAVLRRIEEYPMRWYVSIHNHQFPGGAVRAPM